MELQYLSYDIGTSHKVFWESIKRLTIWLFFAFLGDSSISGFFNIFNEYSKSRIALRTMMIKKQAISNVSRVKIPTLLIEKHTLITLSTVKITTRIRNMATAAFVNSRVNRSKKDSPNESWNWKSLQIVFQYFCHEFHCLHNHNLLQFSSLLNSFWWS